MTTIVDRGREIKQAKMTLYTVRESERETERETDRQTETERDKKREGGDVCCNAHTCFKGL